MKGLSNLEFTSPTTSEMQDNACISKHQIYIVSISSLLPTGESEAFVEYNQPVVVSCFASCVRGPFYIEHYEQGYLYWPHIRYKSCDGLICGTSKRRCIPTQSRRRCQTICVYKCDTDGCAFIGTQSVTYTEHLGCQCECRASEICLPGYTWNTKQCRCMKRNRCHPDYYYDRILRRCIPPIPI